MDNAAILELDGKIYHVSEFKGYEKLNAPFYFEVSFNIDTPLFKNYLGHEVILSQPGLAKNQWRGTVNAITTKSILGKSHETQLVNLIFYHPLKNLFDKNNYQQFYNQNELSVVCYYLKKHNIPFELLGLDPTLLKNQPLLQQLQTQSDLQFIHHLLSRIGVMYFIKQGGCVCFFKRFDFLSNSKLEKIYYLAKQKKQFGDTAHFYKMELTKNIAEYQHDNFNNTPSKDSLKIFSSLSQLKMTTHINLNIDNSKQLNSWYVITKIKHNFLHENNRQTKKPFYENEVSLQQATCSELIPLKNHQATTTNEGTVYAKEQYANLDPKGGYQYQLNNSTAYDNTKKHEQPYIPRVSAYAGAHNKGLHFPLQKEDELLINYLNGTPEKPLILSNLSSKKKNYHAHYKITQQSILSPSIDLALVFDDQDKKNNIKIKAKKNYLELNATEQTHLVELNTAGSLNLKAKQNIGLYARDNEVSIMDQQNLQSSTNINKKIENNYYESTNKNSQIQAKHYQAKIENRWQIKSQNIMLNIDDRIKAEANKGSIKLNSQELINIKAKEIKTSSVKTVSLGLKKTFIKTHNHYSEFLAKNLNTKVQQPINYFGKVNQTTKAKHLEPISPSLNPDLLMHKTIEQKNQTRITHLSWKNNACHINNKAFATFNIRGYKKGDRGQVIIYQCTLKKGASINQSSLEEHDKNETLTKIKSIKFKVGDTSLYNQAFEYNLDPGTALLKIPWQYSNLKNSQQEITYYRFEVELLGTKELEISDPMQWLKDIELTHIKQANVHAIKIVRQQLPKLFTYEYDAINDKHIETVLEKISIAPLIENKVTLKNVPINSEHKIYLLSKEKDHLEVISQDYKSVNLFYVLKLSNNNKNEQREIYSMPKPVIINLNDVAFDSDDKPIIQNPSDKYARLKLSEEELNYFKKNGNNATIFIHGFNVPYGEFGNYPKEVSTKYDTEKLEHFVSRLKVRDKSLKKHYVISDIKYDLKNTVKQNAETYLSDKFKTAKDKEDFYFSEAKNNYMEAFNGTGMHSWLIDFEDNLNNAAGFDNDYRDFSRAIFIAWPGEPKSPADYMAANKKSKQIGRAFAEVLIQLREFSKDMEINVIAHSQGNGVMLSAFDYLGEHHRFTKVDHAFAWQAALPYTALNSELNVGYDPAPFLDPHTKNTIKHKRKRDPWYLPFAFKASKKITVLYSQNDNIVGKVIEQKKQPRGVSEKDVFNRKPLAEYLAGIFTTYLGLGSLYEAANQLSFPASHLLDESKLDALWQSWVESRPYNKISLYDNQNNFLKHSDLEPDLNKQVDCLGREKILHDFCHEISSRIIKNKTKINEKIAWLKNDEYLKGKSAYILLKHIGDLEDELVNIPINKNKNDNPFINFMLNNDSSKNGFIIIKDIIENYLYHEKIQPHLPWLVKMITFVYCTEIATNQNPINGMGWFGADMDNSELIGKYEKSNFFNINCTPWVFHHSDMKVPSDDIMENIYKKRIMFYMHFGQYEQTGQGLKK